MLVIFFLQRKKVLQFDNVKKNEFNNIDFPKNVEQKLGNEYISAHNLSATLNVAGEMSFAIRLENFSM